MPDGVSLPAHPFGDADLFGLVGESSSMWDLRRQVALMAGQGTHVLILGASGTGRELVARAIHARSSRRNRPMISRNAATFPEGLIDAELFGNMRNYPNPGMPERPGLMGEADGSILFPDEFAELPIALQAHLLRVMDEGEYQRLGEATTRRSSFRLIAATNRPERFLKDDIRARLKTRLRLRGLNERREDIPLLVRHLLRRHAVHDPAVAQRFFLGGTPKGEPRISPALMSALVSHHYRTHVRELEGLLLRALLDSPGRYIDLTPEVRQELEIGDAPVAGLTERSRPASPTGGGGSATSRGRGESRRVSPASGRAGGARASGRWGGEEALASRAPGGAGGPAPGAQAGAGTPDPGASGGAGTLEPRASGGACPLDPGASGGAGTPDPGASGGACAPDPEALDGAGAPDAAESDGEGALDPGALDGADAPGAAERAFFARGDALAGFDQAEEPLEAGGPRRPEASRPGAASQDGWLDHARHLIDEAGDAPLTYERLTELCEDLKAAYVVGVYEATGEKLFSAARRLQCNRDVVRRALQRCRRSGA
jgi:hypothetical protein